MQSQTLTAKERQHLEEILDRFDRALRDCRSGNLPSIDEFIGSYQGNQLEYLRREMELVWREVVRGEYVKVRRLGGGGMGEVFLARHVALGREFALKEIKLECLRHGDRAEFEKRFRREIEACGRLEHHPNLVNVTNTGTSDEGAPYLVMDYIEGLDLKQIVERHGPLPAAVAARIIHDAAAGLAHAHEKGLVHRDIKPSNIMISKHGVVVVLDLGLARVIESDRQASVVSMPGLVGSFDYMSPEQCREDEHVDSRADTYALGCTLYFLLTAAPPFAEAKSIFQKLNAHQQDPLPELTRDDIDPQLRRVLDQMTAKERDERFEDLGEVAALLRPLTRDVQLDWLVKHAPERIRETLDSDTHSTVAYQTQKAIHSATGRSLDRARDGSMGSSRFGSATRVIRRQLTRRRFMVIGGLGAISAATAGGIAWSRRRSGAADFLATLPGLNGHWWFDEVPWLLPDVRWQLSQSLGFWSTGVSDLVEAAASADLPKFYAMLRDRIAEVSGSWPDDTASRFGLLKEFDPEKLSEHAFDDVLGQVTRRLTQKQESGEELAGDEHHLLAVIRHYRDEFAQAGPAYEAAFAAYQREGRPGLAALSLADHGQLLSQERKPSLAQEKFNRSRTLLAQNSETSARMLRAFTLDSLCNEADAHRSYGNWAPAHSCLQQALALLDDSPQDHPQRAVFHERSAWYHLDVWRVEKADAEFRAARAIREANDRADNHRAIHFVSWNRQGQAMVDYFLDDAESSAEALKALLPEGMVAGSQNYTEKQMRELQRRQPNVLERLCDAELNDPATRRQADEYLQRAIHVAQEVENFRNDGRWSVLNRLKYKSAVVAVLADDLPAAKERFADAEKDAADFQAKTALTAETTGRGTKPPRFIATQKLASACLDWRSDDPNIKAAGLQRLVDQFQRDPALVTRDELQLLVLVGEWILAGPEASTDKTPQRKLAAGLYRQCNIRPRGEAVGDEQPGGWRLPKLLERYREFAEERMA
jgi:serine/threonine protein kinase